MSHFPPGGLLFIFMILWQQAQSRRLQSQNTAPLWSVLQKAQNASFAAGAAIPAASARSLIAASVHLSLYDPKQKPQAGLARSAAERKKIKYLEVICLLCFLSGYPH